MIAKLLKTFEHFPKQEGEADRSLAVTVHPDCYNYKLIIYINDIRHIAQQIISNDEIKALVPNPEDVIIRRLCRDFNEKFDTPTP